MAQTHFGFQKVDETQKASRVRGVFDSVASRYDVMNDLMSMGLHRAWKAYAVAVANVRPGDHVLDIAGGTGDLAMAFARKVGARGRVVHTDINHAMGDQAVELAKNDYQKLLPTFVLTRMPLVMQILFFGALLSAIKSTSSATLLAPTTSFVENILKQIRPGMSDKQQLVAMRFTLVIFAFCVLAYSIALQGTPIYELVSSAYQVTLVAAFVPLAFGLYWNRATTQGAVVSIFAGIAVWVAFFPQVSTWGELFPGQLAGLLAAVVGMVVGSLAPQWLMNRHEHVSHHLQPHS